MTQQELYELAGKLSSKEIVYLACSHLEHIGKAELTGKLEQPTRIFTVNILCESKNRSIFNKES